MVIGSSSIDYRRVFMNTTNRNVFVYMTMVVAVSLLMPFQFAYAAIGFAKPCRNAEYVKEQV